MEDECGLGLPDDFKVPGYGLQGMQRHVGTSLQPQGYDGGVGVEVVVHGKGNALSGLAGMALQCLPYCSGATAECVVGVCFPADEECRKVCAGCNILHQRGENPVLETIMHGGRAFLSLEFRV